MFKTYDKEIKRILAEKDIKVDWKKILGQHRRMTERIQHERLIHLLVTMFVGTVMSMGAFMTIIFQNAMLAILTILLLILFTAYLFHYRFLENTTQSWYKIEERLVSQLRN